MKIKNIFKQRTLLLILTIFGMTSVSNAQVPGMGSIAGPESSMSEPPAAKSAAKPAAKSETSTTNLDGIIIKYNLGDPYGSNFYNVLADEVSNCQNLRGKSKRDACLDDISDNVKSSFEEAKVKYYQNERKIKFLDYVDKKLTIAKEKDSPAPVDHLEGTIENYISGLKDSDNSK